jgi:hypothetical protein
MKLVYIAGPYSAEHEAQKLKNVLVAWEVARHVWSIPYLAAVCPHANSFLMGGPDISYDKFILGDLEIIRRVDAVVFLPGWKASKGARAEMDHCIEHNIPRVDMEDRFLNPAAHPLTLKEELCAVLGLQPEPEEVAA